MAQNIILKNGNKLVKTMVFIMFLLNYDRVNANHSIWPNSTSYLTPCSSGVNS